MKKKIMLAGIMACLLTGAVSATAAEIDNETSNIVVSGKAQNATATIVLKDNTGKVAYIAEADVKDGKYFKKFKFSAQNPENYTLSVNSGGDDVTNEVISAVYHSEKFESVLTFSGSEANRYFAEGDTIDIAANVKNLYADEESYKLYFACYDGTGKLIGTIVGGENSVGYGGEGEEYASLSVNTTVPAGTKTIKAFAWTSDITPISKAKEQKTGDKSYQDGDTICFMGDSITHIGTYPYFIEHYYQPHYPDRKISFHNKGISGQSAGEVFSRLDWDIFAEKANRVTLMIGVNDISRSFVESASEEDGKYAIEACIANYKKVIDKCKENNVEITLVTPPLVDDDANGKQEKRNEGLKALSTEIKNLAESEGISVYDINTMSNAVTEYGKNTLGETMVIQGRDGVHPTETGYAIIGYGYLTSQGVDGDVARVEIGAEGTETKNATVSSLEYSAEGVSFDYSPKSSPMAKTAAYQNAEKFVPTLTEDLNREIIKVSGLNEGTYALKLGENEVGTYTAQELATGVNIATLEQNPNQKNAKLAYEKLYLKGKEVDKLRAIALTEAWAGKKYDLTTDAGYTAFINKYGTHVYRGYFNQYKQYKPQEEEIKEAVEDYTSQAAQLSTPISYKISLIKK